MSNDLNLKPVQGPTSHPKPNLSSIHPNLVASYSPSPDKVDTNLLIFFHGLGDTEQPFFNLGKSLNLPQTAILSLRAPSQIPLLEEPAFQWWESFDQLGQIIQRPNPTATLHLLTKIIEHLIRDCHWTLPSLHLFGFAQGGSLAGELSLHLSRQPSTSSSSSIGSIVAVSSPLLSHPTVSTRSETKVCLVFRGKEEERMIGRESWRKGYESVKEVRLDGGRGNEGMPRGMGEWREIMRFWSEVLVRRSALERGGDVYELAGGIDAAKAAGAKPPPTSR